MRIISGSLKGRRIETVASSNYRPTTGLLKEAIFSIVASGQFVDEETGESAINNAVVLDAFGGTGALSFEALSRGASKAIIIEKNSDNVAALKQNAENLNISDRVTVVRGDATFLPTSVVKCNVVFIDPPFNHGLVNPVVKNLTLKKWLSPNAILIIRTHLHDSYDIAEFGDEIFTRKYGKSLLSIYRYNNERILI